MKHGAVAKDKVKVKDPKGSFGRIAGKKNEPDMPPPGKRPGADALKRKLEGKKL